MDEGHEVSTAKNGQEAVEQVAAAPPELMVLDIMMPEMDGYDVLRALQERDIKGTTKVLVLTAKGSDHDWKQGYDLGADRYM
ncbi:MAG: response regulator transcription factor, partial [Candidatus Baltobacteraceae bacterium]